MLHPGSFDLNDSRISWHQRVSDSYFERKDLILRDRQHEGTEATRILISIQTESPTRAVGVFHRRVTESGATACKST